LLSHVVELPYNLRGDLTVEGLGWPTDMVADMNMNCIYIGDRYGFKNIQQPDNPGIFVLTESGNPSHHRLDVTPAGLSLTQDGLLLVVCEHHKKGRSLRFFHSERSSDAVELVEVVERRTELQLDRYLLQAVAVGSDRFVISQCRENRDIHRIVVVNNKGTEVS